MLISPMKYARAKRETLAKTATGNAENREELLRGMTLKTKRFLSGNTKTFAEIYLN